MRNQSLIPTISGQKILFSLVCILLAQLSNAQLKDTSFNPDLKTYNSEVYSFAIQPDGKIIIQGEFDKIDGVARSVVGRLNHDGSLDDSFNIGSALTFSDEIRGIAVQTDGRIIVVGKFRRTVGSSRKNIGILRLNSDGTLDASYSPMLSNDDWYVRAAKLQDDGKLVISWTSESQFTSETHYVTRVNQDGTIDNTFACTLNTKKVPFDLTIQPDNKIIVVGSYEQFVSDACLIKRFNPDGSEDTAFNNTISVSNYGISNVSVLTNGNILITGTFEKCNGEARNGGAIFNSDGHLLPDFISTYQNQNATVKHFPIGDDRFLLYGNFAEEHEPKYTTSTMFLLLNSNGTVDDERFSRLQSSKNFVITQHVFHFAPLDDGKFLMNGIWSSIDGVDLPGLVRLNSDFTVDLSFCPRIGDEEFSSVFAVETLANGKILIGGIFNYADDLHRNNIARLNYNGTVDEAFNPGWGANGNVLVIRKQKDEKILVAGNFNYFNQEPHLNIVRLQPDGIIDPDFHADSVNFESIFAMEILDDGKIVIKGRQSEGCGYTEVVKLNTNGSIDVSFNAPPIYNYYERNMSDQKLSCIAALGVQSDGKILTEGIRFNVNGTLDEAYKPREFSWFAAIEPSGKLLMRGRKSSGSGSVDQGLYRANEDGSVNTVFDSSIDQNRVMALYVQKNGKILMSLFPNYSISDYPSTKRLNENGTIDISYKDTNPIRINFERYSIVKQTDELLLVAGNADYAPYPYARGSLVRIQVSNQSTQSISFSAISDQTYLQEFTINLTATSSSGLPISYQVISGPGTVNGNVLSITGPGKITVKAIQNGDGNYFSASTFQTFCINPAKPLVTLTEATGTLAILKSNFDDGNQWYRDGVMLAEESTKTLSITESGTYTVIATIEGCSSIQSDPYVIVITNIEDGLNGKLIYYPNPAGSTFNLDLTSFSNVEKFQIEIVDTSGKTLKHLATENRTVEINMNDLPIGNYFLKVTTPSRSFISHIIKK